jgi:hypothetical protein
MLSVRRTLIDRVDFIVRNMHQPLHLGEKSAMTRSGAPRLFIAITEEVTSSNLVL